MPTFADRLGLSGSALGSIALGGVAPDTYILESEAVTQGTTNPVIARVFDIDGVTPVMTYTVPELPSFQETINASSQPITISIPAQPGQPSTPVSFSTVILADTPTSWLRLDDPGGGTAVDSGGDGNNGSYVGSISYGQPGATEDGDTSVLLYSTDNAYVDLGDFGGNLPNFTEFWVKINQLPPMVGSSLGYAWLIQVAPLFDISIGSDGNLYSHDLGAQTYTKINATASVTDGHWHLIDVHWSIALAGSTVNLFIDGVAQGSFLVENGSYASAILALDPVVYYKYDEASGTTATDYSGHGHTGTYSKTGQQLGQPSIIPNTADTSMIQSSTPGAYVSTPSVPALGNSWSFALWVKMPTDSGKYVTLWGLSDSATGFPFVSNISDGRLIFYEASGTGVVLAGAGSLIDDDNPHMIVVSWDGTHVTYYCDGVLKVTFAPSVTTNMSLAEATHYFTGSGGLAGINWDDTALFPTPLSASQVTALYEAASQAPVPASIRVSSMGYLDEISTYDYQLSPLRMQAHISAAQGSLGGVTTSVNGVILQAGMLVKLYEQMGASEDVLYTGIIASLNYTYDSTIELDIALNPVGAEGGYTDFSQNYTDPVDLAQMVRDAVANTKHLWCTPQSVPDTGQFETYQFEDVHVTDALSNIQQIAGAYYWWYIDHKGCVWFQYMGSGANYILLRDQNYSSATQAPDTTDLRNIIHVIGGLPPGGTEPITSDYVGSDVAIYGPHTLYPNPTYTECTNQATLDKIRNTLATVFDRVYADTTLTITNYNKRILMGQPGGALISYWEPSSNPTPEPAVGSGSLSAPLFVTGVTRTGPTQTVTLDESPVTLNDLSDWIASIAADYGTNQVINTSASLTTPGTVTSGGISTAPVSDGSSNVPAPSPGQAAYVIDSTSFRVYDGSGGDYGAPSGDGVTVEITPSGKFFLGGQAADIQVNDDTGQPRVIIGEY